ncbi:MULTISPECIES: hypothetical protein [Staphylococcus]|uniref:hypothetical protein n=1 Tax=Staphylococcus TaxID=1279 RepID=UPI00048B5716|nr:MULTISPECIES: hypothetical protein [Staphylococcus]
MTYEEIKTMFKPFRNSIDYYSINPLADYYIDYKKENDKTLVLKLKLNEIVPLKKCEKNSFFELALMEDEYYFKYNDLIDNVVNNDNSLQRLPHKKGDNDLGRIIYNSEEEAKNAAKIQFGGSLSVKDILI